MTFRDLMLRLKALAAPKRVERELDEELSFHIERQTYKYVADGLSPAEARRRALAEFGSPALAADQCRDARGTAFVDILMRDLSYAMGTFRRAPLAAATIISTIALGLGLITVVFTFYSAAFLRVDEVRNPGELFEVRRPPAPGAKVWVQSVRRDYEALRQETSVFVDVFATASGVEARIEGREVTGDLVTGNFFSVLGVRAALGRSLEPADDERFAARPVIVLSHRGWMKLFEGDAAAVGRELPINGVSYSVAGVMPPGFHGLAVSPPDYWAPLGLAGQFRPDIQGQEDQLPLTVIGRLKPNLSADVAAEALTVWVKANANIPEVNGRAKSITLIPRQGAASAGALEGLRLFLPAFIAFGLILLIGCANVANLLLSRGVARQREIGIRLALGASRGRIVRQLLTESLLLATAAAACGFVAARWIFAGMSTAASAALSPALAEQIDLAALALDGRVAVFLAFGAAIATACFGLVPALLSTRLELVRTIRGEVIRDGRPQRGRHALIALQVTASAVLLICAAVFLRGTLAAARHEPGLRTTDTMMLQLTNEPTRVAMLQAVVSDPLVASVAASWPHGIGGALGSATGSVQAPVDYKFVSPEYFGLLGIEIVKGRGFSASERDTSSGVVVISHSTASRLWPGQDPIGEVMQLELEEGRIVHVGEAGARPEMYTHTFTVIGVVQQVRVGLAMFSLSDAGVYLPVDATAAGTSLVMRVNGDPDRLRDQLVGRLSSVDPTIGTVTALKTVANRTAFVMEVATWVVGVLASLALLLTASGLFSVLSYAVAQRTREIGVRMALGATSWRVATLILQQSARPVAVGVTIGLTISLAVAAPLASASLPFELGDVIHVFDTVAYATSVAVIVAVCALAALVPAAHAARIDPTTTLRQD